MRRVGLFLVLGLVLMVVLAACGKEAEPAPEDIIAPTPAPTPLWAPAWAPAMAPATTPEAIMATTSASSTKTTP